MTDVLVASPDFQIVTAAAVFAAQAHATQKRKELNEPYIVHPLRVGKMAAMLDMDAAFIAACYLHDVVEDTDVPIETIAGLFPERTTELVRAMTKWWGAGHPDKVVSSNKQTYYDNLIATPDGALLKVLDRIDNLHDFTKVARLSPSSHKWAKKYYQKTGTEFVPILRAVEAMTEPRPKAVQWFVNALVGLESAL